MEQNKPKLILLSAHYPYGNGETFLEDEIRITERYFSDIIIVSADKEKQITRRYIPENTTVVNLRERRIQLCPLLISLLEMFFPQTWKEKQFAYHELGYSRQRKTVNKLIFINYYISAILERTMRKLPNLDNVVFYAYWMSSEAFFLSKYKNKHPNVTCVCRTHGGDCYIDKFYQPFRREILSSLDAVYPISEAGRECIETLLMPYVTGRHVPLNVERLGVTKLSSKMNPVAKNGMFYIVTCSNVIPLKRLDLIIDALAMLRDRQIHWVHFGDGIIMDEVQQQADAKLSNSSITFEFKGRVAKSDVLRWYEENHVDLFVNCSDSEGIPVSVMEAYAYGIPAVARDVGGINELVISGKNGILLPAVCTAEELRNAIAEMIEKSETEMRHYRDGAYQTYQDSYCAERNYREFYQQILTTHE